MEAACKAASRTAQLLTKDTTPEEVSQMMAVMASVKEQLSKVCPCRHTEHQEVVFSFLCVVVTLLCTPTWSRTITVKMFSSNQVRERCLPLLRESQSLLPSLEEMEKNISGFYQALEKASHITSTTESEGHVDFKQKCQVIKNNSSVY